MERNLSTAAAYTHEYYFQYDKLILIVFFVVVILVCFSVCSLVSFGFPIKRVCMYIVSFYICSETSKVCVYMCDGNGYVSGVVAVCLWVMINKIYRLSIYYLVQSTTGKQIYNWKRIYFWWFLQCDVLIEILKHQQQPLKKGKFAAVVFLFHSIYWMYFFSLQIPIDRNLNV